MNYLPPITIILWLALLAGNMLMPGTFPAEHIQLPLVILLSIFLPVSFWQLSRQGKKAYSLVFIAIFLFNIAILANTLEDHYLALEDIQQGYGQGVSPALLDTLVNGESETLRRKAARMIYWQNGIRLLFHTEDGGYALFTPDETDIRKHNRYLIGYSDSENLRRSISSQRWIILLVMVLHAALFLSLLIYLTLRDNRPRLSP